MSEQSLGATSVALGDTRPDNTSAIIALQRAASTPNEITKQNLYDAVEDLFRIYLEFMGEYYGKRFVDSPITSKEREAVLFAQPLNPDLEVPEEVPVEFDFSLLKEHPVIIKLDVGASTYYSEIAATQTLDNLLMNGHIDIIEYLERVPDDRIPGRRALLEAKIKARDAIQQAQAMPPVGGGEQIPGMPQAGAIQDLGIKPDVPTGSGYSNLQRTINKTGTTEGLV
jgi:hypothetical protein